ncbi:hypothetical protein ACFWY5_31960 [Nonomuraea sp. NPDC059007]|uniref:hypothetical protein n=1 Tax=Nonomuraea sp. NPDC059007 TaxID=3346692 RepID=UPI00369826C9
MITLSWVLLVLASLNAVLGGYVVITGRVPVWGLWLSRSRHSRLGGWANLLIAAFVALMVISQHADLPPAAAFSLLAVQILAGMGAVALWIVEAGRQRT